MRLIDEHSAEEYLRQTGRIDPNERVCVRELGGGVSNMVLLVERRGGAMVIKQAREQLRTAQPWFSRVERIWREADVLSICERLLASKPGGAVDHVAARTPRILFEDRDNYLFAMEPAPRPNTTWKAQLLAGRADPAIAAACGRLLGTLHAESWRDAALRRQIGDCTLFDELRVDPYYRTLAQAHPGAKPALDELIDSMAANACSLVHADFSPKNLLVFEDGLMMVDFETGHFGDPAFDLGFFSSHLVLKACCKIPDHERYLAASEAFWQSYRKLMAAKISPAELRGLSARGVRHFAACGWARLDGKSPVEYLTDPARRQQMRGLCETVLQRPTSDWPEVVSLARKRFD